MIFKPSRTSMLISFLFLIIISQGILAQQHEKANSEPAVVAPGIRRGPPSDAIVLFDRDTLDQWRSVQTGGAAQWNVTGDKFTVKPGAGNIETKEIFGDCQLHIEWKTPKKDVYEGKKGQQNGNSGIYFMSKYEIQVLNSFRNPSGNTGQAGAYYGHTPPLVNASKPEGKWQVYDIIFEAPEWNGNDSLVKPGYITVFHNGVLVQNHTEIIAPTASHNESYSLDSGELPLMLQEHKNEVSYRNIWIRKL